MEKIIYRGFDVHIFEEGWAIYESGRRLHVAKSENGAYAWIDAEHRVRRVRSGQQTVSKHDE